MAEKILDEQATNNTIPSGWIETTLGAIAKMGNDKINIHQLTLDNYISTDNLLPEKMGVVRAVNLPNVSNVNAFKMNDTLFSNIRTYFKKVWLAKFCGGASNDVIIFIPISENILDKRFLYYLIASDKFIDFTSNTSKGTKMPRGDKDSMNSYSLLLPPLPEQKAIAAVLSAFDDKIELLREEYKTLEEIGKTIFNEWFVNFNFPDKNGKPYKKSGGKMVHTELGEIPEGWRVFKLAEIANIVNGYAYKGSELVENSNSALVTLKSFNRNGGFQTRGFKPFIGNPKETQEVKIGDLVVACTDLTQDAEVLGNPALILEDGGFEKMYITMDLVKVVPKNKNITIAFLYYLMQTKEFKGHCVGYSNGTTVLHLSKKAIPEYQIVLPKNFEILSNISLLLKEITEKMVTINSQVQTLLKTRDEILPRLISGNLRVEGF